LVVSFSAHGAERNSITIERDKDRTVYTIGSSEGDQTKEDTENAWEMLKGVIIDARGALGKGPDNNR
jgi:hypothetical protein